MERVNYKSLGRMIGRRALLPRQIDGPVLGVVVALVTGVQRALFFAVEWPFASFLITAHSRNWLFNGNNYVYFMSHQFQARTFHFADWDPWVRPLAPQLALAFVLGTVSSYLALKWGSWMTRVRR